MISIGLTGNVGCGKSTVAAAWRELGAEVIDADALVHELLAPGGAAADTVLASFPSARGDDGGVDRAALAGLVFGDDLGDVVAGAAVGAAGGAIVGSAQENSPSSAGSS